MAIEGDGGWAISVMWAICFVVLTFVVLRIYTRVVLIHWFGVDDLAYLIAFAFLLFFCIIMTLSAHYGFGQEPVEDPSDEATALFYEGIGINLIATGMVIAKWSLGLFLLRIIKEPWQRACIWAVLVFLLATSCAVVVVYWLQCQPIQYLWDKRIEGGKCDIDFVPVAFVVTSVCVFADFFFAIFPFVVIWKVQMNPRDKILILASLSLGLFAGACGIKRTTEIGELWAPDFLKATVGAAVWSVAEMGVTMVCISIPVCLPFFKRVHGKWSTKDEDSNGTGILDAPAEDPADSRRKSSAPSTVILMARRLGMNSVMDTLMDTYVAEEPEDEEMGRPDSRRCRGGSEHTLQGEEDHESEINSHQRKADEIPNERKSKEILNEKGGA